MQRPRIEHLPAAQLHAICERAQRGQDTVIECRTYRAGMKIANAFWTYRKLMRERIELARKSGQLVEMPFGLEQTGCQVDKNTGRVTFSSRENNAISRALTAALEHGHVALDADGRALPVEGSAGPKPPGSSGTKPPNPVAAAPAPAQDRILAAYGLGGSDV